MTVFENLSSVNLNGKTEKKGNLTYLSWSYAWGELKKRYPNSTYTVYENRNGWNYFTDGRTAWVKTGVTVEGIEYIEYLPVMDHRNNSLPLDKVTSQDVNKTIQRSLTKAIARHGLGLYIYNGEDLPEGAEPTAEPEEEPEEEPVVEVVPLQWQNRKCEVCGKELEPRVAARSFEVFNGHMFCSKEHRAERNNGEPEDVSDIQREIEKNLKKRRAAK